MKIVINRCYGGFSLSNKVMRHLGFEADDYGYVENSSFNIDDNNYQAYRTHPALIDAIETIGLEESSGTYSELRIINIPDDMDWYIEDYDGLESVHEHHKSFS